MMVYANRLQFSALSCQDAEFIPAGENCNAKIFDNGLNPQRFGQGEVAELAGPLGSALRNDGLFQELKQNIISKLDSGDAYVPGS